jgi:hypothetical protein
MLVYTSVTNSYIPKARILAKSLKRFHPEWEFQLVLSDCIPVDFNLEEEPFDGVLTIDQMGIPNWKSWAFGHTVVELCTAVKGVAGQLFAARPGVEKIIYLDPDIKVFGSLTPISDWLNHSSILLTPHLLEAETTPQAILDNEISALKHGIYNLGFYAARTNGQGIQFIDWWAKRLLLFCIDDIPNGLFTDQRWCDLAPAFFDELTIIRDPGYNVATWNLGHRKISKGNDGAYMAGGVPLRFYHFTGYDSGNGMGMLNKYGSNESVAQELWRDYAEDLLRAGNSDPAYREWRYSKFSNGSSIPLDARRLYRVRGDLQAAFPDPYNADVDRSFFAWWIADGGKVRTLDVYKKVFRSFLSKVLPSRVKTFLRKIK